MTEETLDNPTNERTAQTGFFSKEVLFSGIKAGLPIGLGYFAVAFSLGIAVRNAGMSAFQGFLLSITNNASAGQYAGLVSIATKASYFEIAIVTFVANCRYILMSCALSQRLDPETPFYHRFLLGFDVTDELFGITIARPGYLNPFYTYGAVLAAAPGWAIGTAIGVTAGNLLPPSLVSALSVALYGMFLAVIIPPARKNFVIAGLILISFAASYFTTYLTVLSKFSAGTRTILLTVVISFLAAILFPISRKKGQNGE